MKSVPSFATSAPLRQAVRSLLPVLRLFVEVRGGLLLGGTLLASLTVLAGMALLGLSGWFISATALAGLSVATALAFDVFMPSSGIRLFTLMRTAARYGERLVTHDATLAVLADLRVRLFRGWAQPGVARELALRPSRLLFRLTADIDALDSLYLRVLTPLVAALMATLAAAITLGLVHAGLGLATLLATALCTLLVLQRTWRAAVRPARLRAHAIEALRTQTADLVAGQSELLLADRLTAQRRHIESIDARLAGYDDRLQRLDGQAALGLAVLSNGLLAATLLVAGALVSTGAIGVPVAVLAILVALGLGEPLAGLRRGVLELGRTTLAARRLGPQLANGPQPAAGTLADQPSAVIDLRGVSARHQGSTLDCLHDLELRVQAGERVALVGSSGAGKSSLMALLTGELQAHSGSVRMGRHGWLTQRTELFQDSLRDNLRLANPAASDAQLWQALETAGLAGSVATWSHGLDTLLGEGGQGLSGGQARRLALARLLLREAPTWLLDEPTDGLDAQTARDVLARLDAQGRAHTWLLATHLRREAALAERLVLIRDGRIEGDYRRHSPGYDALLRSLRAD